MFSVIPSSPTSLSRWDYHPAFSSPLASSPAHAPSSPLAPISPNAFPRQSQSSPIRGPPSKFKYASQSARRNPLNRSRHEKGDARRKLFMQNVRQRADDRAWKRRDIESFTNTSQWYEEERRRMERILAAEEGRLTETDMQDGMESGPDSTGAWSETNFESLTSQELDQLMALDIERQEERELDHLFSSFDQAMEPLEAARDQAQGTKQAPTQSLFRFPLETLGDSPAAGGQVPAPGGFDAREPHSPTISDDEDFDRLLMELVSDDEPHSGETMDLA